MNILDELTGLTLFKGHATHNDFLVLDDPVGVMNLSDSHIAALCDRRGGFGADGLIRIVRTGQTECATGDPDIDRLYLMDYRNADGSYAQMCGNGIRLFTHYLINLNKVTLDEHSSVLVNTRGGVRKVTRTADGLYTVDMGAPTIPGSASTGRETVAVTIAGIDATLSARCVDMPNPHTVAVVDTVQSVQQALLPQTDPEDCPVHLRPIQEPPAPEGTNFEIIAIDEEASRIDMRVCERGVGETMSCGTGCCASAVVASQLHPGTATWDVHVPGGVVTVKVGQTIEMTGPATHVGIVSVSELGSQ